MENAQEEIWKPIIFGGIDYTGLYEVSNLGRIKSVTKNNKILKGSVHTNGYIQQTLRFNKSQRTIKLHKIVAVVFGIDKDGFVIDHINSNKKDNRLINLCSVTIRENVAKERTLKSGLPIGACLTNRSTLNIYESQIEINKKKVYLGLYSKACQASKAYKIALEIGEKNNNLKDVHQAIDNYRLSIGLNPIKRNKKATLTH